MENAKDSELARTATDAALVRVREMREEKRRTLDSPDFEHSGNPSLEERASRANMEAEHVEHVKPSSSRDRIRRDRPVEPEEEEESKQLRLSDPTGQKRKGLETMKEHQSRAKAKAADPAGSKRKPSKVAEGTPVKAKMAEPTGEKRKADSDTKMKKHKEVR